MGTETLALGALSGMIPGLTGGLGSLFGLGGTAAAGAAAAPSAFATFGKDLLGGAATGAFKSGIGSLLNPQQGGAQFSIPELPPVTLPQFGNPGIMGRQPTPVIPLSPLQQLGGMDGLSMSGTGGPFDFYTRRYR